MRKLASIKTIAALTPIEGKDRIELATVDGWSVIVKKDEFKVGDKCVYIEIDSVLPEIPEFEFLRSKNFRIKTMKMAGCISQGICFPLSVLKDSPDKYQADQDVTEELGVTQYEPTMDIERDTASANNKKKKYPRFLMKHKWFRNLVLGRGKKNTDFPAFISKTDEIRIQNIPNVLADKQPWVATEKIDGQSGTFILRKRKGFERLFKGKYEYIVCSRNKRLPENDGSSYWRVSDKYDIRGLLEGLIGVRETDGREMNPEWVAIQGEVVGPKIQGNKYGLDDYRLYVFNLIYPDIGRQGTAAAKATVDLIADSREMCGCEFPTPRFVPVLDYSYVLPDTVEEVLEFAHGKSAIGNNMREGIVFRSRDGKKSFKAVDPLFLLKYDE